MHRMFHSLLYKVKSEFVLLSSNSGGTFRELRLLVEKAASAAASPYGQLLQSDRSQNSKEREKPMSSTKFNICVAQQ